MSGKIIGLYFIREALGLAVMGAALFWPAGRLNWLAAWGALLVSAAWIAGTAIAILRTNPSLLAERLGPRKGAKRWDTAILSAMGLVTLARYIIAGFDQRYGWTSGDFSPLAQGLALLACALGYALFVWAVASNAFFSQVVRLQPERGQTVARGGPYRSLRHPAYLGAVVYELAVSILLASWCALGISAVSVGLLITRTALEDRTLKAELAGYAEYAREVRWRLLPGVW